MRIHGDVDSGVGTIGESAVILRDESGLDEQGERVRAGCSIRMCQFERLPGEGRVSVEHAESDTRGLERGIGLAVHVEGDRSVLRSADAAAPFEIAVVPAARRVHSDVEVVATIIDFHAREPGHGRVPTRDTHRVIDPADDFAVAYFEIAQFSVGEL